MTRTRYARWLRIRGLSKTPEPYRNPVTGSRSVPVSYPYRNPVTEGERAANGAGR